MSSLYVHLPLPPVSGNSEFACVLCADGRTPGAVTRTVASLLPAATGAGAEVVAIMTPNDSHFRFSMLALEHGMPPAGGLGESPSGSVRKASREKGNTAR